MRAEGRAPTSSLLARRCFSTSLPMRTSKSHPPPGEVVTHTHIQTHCEGGHEGSQGRDVRPAGVVCTLYLSLAVALDLEVLRRRMVGRHGVNVFYTQERTRVEVYSDGAALKMRVEAGTLSAADAAATLLANDARSIKEAIDAG